MKALWTAGVSALVLAACLAAGSGAAMNAPSGDTCSVTGGGTSYTVVINLPANAQEQGAFAFGGATRDQHRHPGDSGCALDHGHAGRHDRDVDAERLLPFPASRSRRA